ncbi:MAG: hypothetical protein RI973_1901, partial [Bacteroidota bacterium]
MVQLQQNCATGLLLIFIISLILFKTVCLIKKIFRRLVSQFCY